jgi:hypothetical protein
MKITNMHQVYTEGLTHAGGSEPLNYILHLKVKFLGMVVHWKRVAFNGMIRKGYDSQTYVRLLHPHSNPNRNVRH